MPDDFSAAPAPAASNEPVIAATPAPLNVEPRVAPAESAIKEAPAPKVEPKAAEPAKPLSTREAIRAAAAKVNAEPASQSATPLKDLAPKEPAAPAVAKDAAPVVAAKDAKAAEPVPAVAVTRDETTGKFVSTKAAEPAAPVDAKVAPAAEPAKVALPSHTAEPAPKRFSAEAKDEWAAAPEKVRAEVARMEKELTAGFEKHRAAAERDSSVAEFHEMATKSNTTLKEALKNYTNMEQLLRSEATRDKGFEALFQNIGISPREWAAKVLGQTPDAAASAADSRVIELEAKIARLEQGVGSLHAEREQARTDTTHADVTKFAAANPRFEELSDDIAFFLKAGRTKDLAEAYKLAERLNPAPAAQAPAALPDAASSAPPVSKPTLVASTPSPPAPSSDAGTRSIAGTPSSGSDPVRKQPSNSIKEAIRRAAAAAG